MSDSLEHVPVPVARFRGPHHQRIAQSRSWQEVFAKSVPADLEACLGVAYRSRRPTDVQLRLSTRTCVDRHFRVLIKPLPGNELLATCIDVSNEYQARQAAVVTARIKERVLMTVSHDLRSPVSTMLLWEQVLRVRIDEVEIRERALDAIRDSAVTQSELIGELVEVFKVLGAESQQPGRVPLESMLESAKRSELERARGKGIRLVDRFERPLGDVHAEPAQLGLAIKKVLETAIKLTTPNTTIVLDAKAAHDRFSVTIGAAAACRGRPAPPNAVLEAQLVLATELLALHGGGLRIMTSPKGDATGFGISLPIMASVAS